MLLLTILLFIASTVHINGDNGLEMAPDVLESTSVQDQNNDSIMKLIDKFEIISSHTTQTALKGVISVENMEVLYSNMAEILDDIIEMLRERSNIYKFIKEKGINRIIDTHIKINNTKLRIRLIVILKVLFNKAHTSTNASISYNILDELLEIFENDNNLAIKAHVLDILNSWLPENPKIQARVMQVKGLEPFYNQVAKLDVNVIKTLLDLFNRVLKEHLKERNKKIQQSKADLDRLRLYQKIGLLERMSTPAVCNGLLNIFEVIWNYGNDIKNIFDVFDLLKNVKPFCINIFRGKTKAKELFEKLSHYVKDEDEFRYLEKDLNVTDVKLVFSDYIGDVKGGPYKDEF